jgi:hypothetical protein
MKCPGCLKEHEPTPTCGGAAQYMAGKPLESLSDYNARQSRERDEREAARRSELHASTIREVLDRSTGIACPKCGHELFEGHISVHGPKGENDPAWREFRSKLEVLCVACGHKDWRDEYAADQAWKSPSVKNQPTT